jgi:TonB family protein
MQRLTFRLTITFISGFVYLILSAFSATAQEKPSSNLPPIADNNVWAKYTGKGEAFTVLLPEPPTATIINRPVRFVLARDAELYRGTRYTAYSDGVVYSIYSFPRRSEPLKQLVDEFTDRYTQRQQVVFTRDLNLNGAAGQRYLITIRDVDGVLDFYMTDQRVYILHVVGGNESNPSIKRFLESFTIGKADKAGDSAAIEIKPDSKKSSQVDNAPDPGPLFTSSEVTRKAVIVIRPEPQYTEEARQGRVSGTVILRVVLSSSGKVTNIEAKISLPRGLTEKAMEAARQIKFVPAMKDGKFVSQSVQVEYNFSVY